LKIEIASFLMLVSSRLNKRLVAIKLALAKTFKNLYVNL